VRAEGVSDPSRSSHTFPSRRYSYGAAEESVRGLAAGLTASRFFRFVKGRHTGLVPFPPEMVRALRDPFARLILGHESAPLTARALLAALDAANAEAEGVPEQRSFVVADGGQIPWSPETDGLNRQFRLVITRGRAGQTPTLLISTSTALDSTSTFLQVIGWDPGLEAYQFYDRREGFWIWAGSSWDALTLDSRGRGPFDSHVNGALNMKELKLPWIHWHSQAAAIRDEVLAPDDPLRGEPLWQNRSEAQHFETAVARPGIERWNQARFRRLTADGHLHLAVEALRNVLETTTVNLVASSEQRGRLRAGRPLLLPFTFFIHADALVDLLGLDPGITSPLQVDGGVYAECLARYEVALAEEARRFPGDAHFAFLVPEPAYEDLVVLKELLRLRVLSEKTAACLLMVDFCNAVFSRRRAALLRYVPQTVDLGTPGDFERQFLRAIEVVAPTLAPEAPEREFLANRGLTEQAWRGEFEARIKRFLDAVAARLATLDEFAPVFELADSRRREFRRRPLAEFPLTVPRTNIPQDAPFLEFAPDGEVRARAE
jgi:hypothetical protein